MHGLAVYVKEGLPFARDLSLENSADSYLCFRLALLHSVPYFFFLYGPPSSSLSTIFYSVSSNIDEVLSITHLLMLLSLETLMSIIKAGLPILVELINLLNSYNFSISTDLMQIVIFLLGSQIVILIVLLFWIYLFLLMLVFVLQWLSFIWKSWSCCCLSFHWLGIIFTTGCPISWHRLLLFSCWLRWSLWSFEKSSMGEYL